MQLASKGAKNSKKENSWYGKYYEAIQLHCIRIPTSPKGDLSCRAGLSASGGQPGIGELPPARGGLQEFN